MALADSEAGWGWPTRLMHWAMAALILFMLGLGVFMTNARIDLMQRFELTQLHKSIGVVVFGLALARVGWRLLQPGRPELPAGTPPWRRRAARASHLLLYLLMIAMPVSGWLMASASPLQDVLPFEHRVFGLFALPDPFIPGGKALEAVFRTAHVAGAIALAALLLVHAGAALEHHFRLRDAVLRRMVLGR